MHNKMKILAIETTGHFASASIGNSFIQNDTDYSHLQEIIPMVQEILDKEAVKPEELDYIAVSRGPGSFTGIRIGMATAKGLALVWNKKIITVPTLASFSFGKYKSVPDNGLICPVFDARRNQVYAAAYKKENLTAAVKDGAYDIEEYLKLLKDTGIPECCFLGDGTAKYEGILAEAGFIVPKEERFQSAASVLRLAEYIAENDIREYIKDAYTSEPEYLRAAEAERKLKEKNRNEGK